MRCITITALGKDLFDFFLEARREQKQAGGDRLTGTQYELNNPKPNNSRFLTQVDLGKHTHTHTYAHT